jgi:hypothetical protein
VIQLDQAIAELNDEDYARHVTKRLELYAVLQEIVADAVDQDLEPEAVRAYWRFGARNYDGAPE